MVCPDFASTGSCPQGKKCRLLHRSKVKDRKGQGSNKVTVSAKKLVLTFSLNIVCFSKSLNPLLIARSMLKKAQTVRLKKSNCPKLDALPANILFLSRFWSSYIFKGKLLQNPRRVRNETLFHWLTKPNRKRKYNDLRKEHSRSPNESFSRKSLAELFWRTSSCQLKESFRQIPFTAENIADYRRNLIL